MFDKSLTMKNISDLYNLVIKFENKTAPVNQQHNAIHMSVCIQSSLQKDLTIDIYTETYIAPES